MESHTFGNSKAAEVLAEILDKYPHLQRKVGGYWNDYTHDMNEIDNCCMNRSVKLYLVELYYHDKTKVIDNSDMPQEVKMFLKNIMVKRWRQIKASLS